MKLHLLILNIFIVLPMTGIGQTNRFDIGVEAGPNVLFFRGKQDIKGFGEPRPGVSTAITFRYNFPKYFSIGISPSFERKRSYTYINSSVLPEGGLTDRINKFDHLTIPFLGRFTLGAKFRFFLSAGPYLSYLIQQTTTNVIGDTQFESYDNTEFYKRLEFGITTGLGFGVHIKDLVLISLEIRNNTGLTNILDQSAYKSGYLNTNTITPFIGVTYSFRSS